MIQYQSSGDRLHGVLIFGRWTAAIALLVIITTANAENVGTMEQMTREIEQLRQMLVHQQTEINELRSEQVFNSASLQQRQDLVRELVHDTINDVEIRSQLLGDTLTAGYNKGFFIQSPDEAYKLKINTRLQFRYTGINRATPPTSVAARAEATDRSDFELERAKIAFSGHMPSGINDEPIKYKIQLDADTDDETSRHGTTLEDWYAEHKTLAWLTLRVGQFKGPQGQQELTSSGKQQFVDRSMINELFNLDRSIGAQAKTSLFGKNNAGKNRVVIVYSVTNGYDQDSDHYSPQDNNFAYSARAAWNVFGNVGKDESALGWQKGKYDEGAVRMGMHVAYFDENANDEPEFDGISLDGGLPGVATLEAQGTEQIQLGFDMRYKLKRLSVNVEYFLRIIDIDAGSRALFDSRKINLPNGVGDEEAVAEIIGLDTEHIQGGYVQIGYFITEKVELAGRFGGVWDNESDGHHELVFGMNYFIRGHDVKLTADYTAVDETVSDSSAAGFVPGEKINMYRGQLQIAF